MSSPEIKSSKRVLEPSERIAEVLFGLIMVLTITGSLSVAEAAHDDVNTMLIGALGCNTAWGIIDGVLFLMGCLAEKGQNLKTYRALRATNDPGTARQLITSALPSVFASVMQPAEFEALHQRLQQLPEPPRRAQLHASDLRGATGVFFLVFLSTLPVALPFMFMPTLMGAMRISNFVAVTMLFFCGAAYARCIGRSPWVVGLVMVGLGGLLVTLTILLGG